MQGWKLVSFRLTIQPPLLAQEPDFVVGIAPHQAHNDRFLLTTLKSVDRT
jgi:hypothetical protein